VILFRPLSEVSVGLLFADAVARHVAIPVLQHATALGSVGVNEQVAHNDETAPLERHVDRAIKVPLLVALGDVVECERGYDGVTAGQLVLEEAPPQIESTGVSGTSSCGNLQHVRVDVDQLDAHVGGMASRIAAARPPVPAPRSTTKPLGGT
jgi:hypothetical protein